MITCNLMGGLGNQLFQIFAMMAYGMQHSKQFRFLHSDYLGGDSSMKRSTYWNTFLYSLQNFTVKTLPGNMHIVDAGPFEYRELPVFNIENEHILFQGYFQSYKYFEPFQENIYRLIRLNETKKSCLQKYINIHPENKISMHFRLGDYKGLGYFHPILNFHYYKNSLTHIISSLNQEEPYKILYFCEAEDNDSVKETISQLEGVFPECIFEKVSDEMADWEQLVIMSCCKHNIIANSSFSWFGAYLNQNSDKIVCYPEQWFCGHGEHIYVGDLFPEKWTKIQCS